MTPEQIAWHKLWKPASGHPGGWRVCRKFYDRTDGGSSVEQLEAKDSRFRRPVLFKSQEAAQRRADEMNGLEPIVSVPKRVAAVVDRARRAGGVTKTMPLAYAGEAIVHWNYLDGTEAPDLSVRQAIERGLLVPAGDGLFGTELSQTFRAA